MKFLCTSELGRLAKWLRAIGYDAIYLEEKVKIPELLALATTEKRTILTRLKRLQGHKGTPVIVVASDRVKDQMGELKRALGIRPTKNRFFERCILCNVLVQPVSKEKVKGKVPPYVFETQTSFSRCPSCKRIYWAATHYGRAKAFVGLS